MFVYANSTIRVAEFVFYKWRFNESCFLRERGTLFVVSKTLKKGDEETTTKKIGFCKAVNHVKIF